MDDFDGRVLLCIIGGKINISGRLALEYEKGLASHKHRPAPEPVQKLNLIWVDMRNDLDGNNFSPFAVFGFKFKAVQDHMTRFQDGGL